MRMIIALFVLYIFAQPALLFAATPEEPAYRTVKASANYPWSRGLTLALEPDEAQCRAKYGKSWSVKCSAALGQPGTTVKGVKMSPPATGRWQWTDAMSMEFIPENGNSIRPATKYTVDLAGLFHPSFVVLDKKKVTFSTRPLSARLVNLNFWIAPAPDSRHRLAGSFEFNYPVPEVMDKITLVTPDGSAFGNPEMVWSHNRDRLNISWPVQKLPPAPASVKVVFPEMAQIALKDGDLHYWPAQKDKGTVFECNLPARDGLFGIKKMELAPALDDNLNRCYELEVETTLYASPQELRKNLHVLELPEYNSPAAREPYNWQLSPGLSESVLAKSRKLDPVVINGEKTDRTNFRFRIEPVSGRYVLAFITADMLSASDQKLKRPFMRIFKAEKTSPNISFLQPGHILPLNGNGTLDIYATDLDSIGWEAQLVREPFLALIAESSPTPFKTPLTRLDMGMESFSVSQKGTLPIQKKQAGKAQFAALDLAPIIKELSRQDKGDESSSGLVRVTLTGIKDGREAAWASRLILASNLSLLVKRGPEGALDCFAQSLENGLPASGAKISILGANGKPVVSGMADSLGHISFPALQGLKREAEPVAAVAQKNGQLAWLPLQDRALELNYSEFSTGGSHATTNGINAFIFGQRGIYQPGDTLYFGCVARRADMAALPQDLPLYAELLDPRGAKIHEKVFKAGEFGLSEISWKLPESAISGRYLLNVLTGRNGEHIGSATVRVEEFQPDTLKLKIDLPKVAGWLHLDPEAIKHASINFALQNLYGTPADGHKIQAKIEAFPAYFNFPQYGEYVFTDASQLKGNGLKLNLPEAKTDAEGKAAIKLPPEIIGASSIRLVVSGKGFDKSGGRATVAQAHVLASPMEKMVGYRPLASLTNMNFIPQGQKAALEFIAIDPNLQKTSWQGINFTVAHRVHVTSLVSDGNGGYRYDETPADMPVRAWTQDIPANGLELELDTAIAGEYLLTAKDGNGAIVAMIPYAVAGERLDPPDTPLAGGKMRLRLDRDAYEVGDEIHMALAVPYDGYGLISIERDGVAAFQWFEAKAGESAHKIRVPANFEGKGYVVVSFTRSPDSSAIYMSPHTFAVAPFSANIKTRDMALRLEAPEKTLPGKNLPVKISAKEQGMAVIFAVDEGVLQLTAHKTPQPLSTLLTDRALDVRTLQAMDLLMPAHAHLARRISAFGGGMDSAIFGARFQNPFKRKDEPPVATWSSVMPVGPDPVEINFPVPDYYNGKMRIMAVGVSANGAGGAAQETTAVAPLALTPSLPLTVSPGDIFEGSLTIANTTDKDAEINFALDAGSQFALQSNPAQTIKIAAGAEVLVPFGLETKDEPGAGEIRFTVQEGKNTYTRKSYLSVRPNSPLRTSLLAGIAKGDMEIPVNRDVYPNMAKSEATLSALPIPLAAGFAEYLQTYPYGCSEQLISRAFAQNLLRAWPGVSGDIHARQKLLESTLAALRARFNGNGISLWPDMEADPLLTTYALDFLLSLREAGIPAGDDLLDSLLGMVEANCVLNDSTLSAARICAYGIWTLTRAGRVTTQLIENLLQAIRERDIPGWQQDIAAALLAASQREMHMSRVLPFEITSYQGDGWFDEFAQYALHMTIMARYFPEQCGNDKRRGFYEAAGMVMSQNGFATFSANQGIRALLTLAADTAPNMSQAALRCSQDGSNGETTLLGNGAMLNYKIGECKKYALDMPPLSPELFWQIAVTGFDRTGAEQSIARGIEITRKYLDQHGREATSFGLGDLATVEITVRAMQDVIKDCVITDLLPGGFEMVLKRGDNPREDFPRGVKFIDRREDRMLVFADITNTPMTFTYDIRAGNAGKFKTAPISAEAMYDSSLYGHGQAGSLVVAQEAR